MGNFIKETVAKVAGNVTQSVTSAVIVTLLTTYVLVDVGKKDSTPPGPKGDSLKINTALPLVNQPDSKTSNDFDKKTDPSRSAEENNLSPNNGTQRSDGRTISRGVVSLGPSERDVKMVADKSSKQPKLETTLLETKAKNDTVAKEKQIPKDVKHVQKRAEDVFDELDEEVAKPPPH